MTKVLIVEDEISLMEVYSIVLKEEGYEVLQALSGEEGLKLALNESWDIAFFDIMLPDLDGIELLKRVNEAGLTKQRPVVIFTNLNNDALVNECLKYGAVEHISKADVTPQALLDAIEKYTTIN